MMITKKSSMGEKGIVAGIIIVVSLILLIAISPIIKVDAGERGVLLQWGAINNDVIYEPGIHWRMPIRDKVVKMDVRTQKEERGASASSKDLQIVTSKIAINYHLDPLKVNSLYENLRKDYSDRVISPAIEEFVKKITAQFTAEELITKREDVKQQLKGVIKENLATNHIIVEDIFITDFDFSDEFNKAIEAKVTAEQRALEEKNKTVQIEEQKKQKILQAEGEAEAIRIQANAINSQGGADYVQLKAIEKWSGILPTQMIPEGAVPFINL